MQTTQPNKRYRLEVDVRRGRDFEDKKLLGSHSVYVAIDCNGETQHTSKVKHLSECIWNERFVFESDNMFEYVDFRVRDDRSLLPNINLGNYHVPIKERLMNYHTHEPFVAEDGDIALRESITGHLDIRVVLTDAKSFYIDESKSCCAANISTSISSTSSAYSENLTATATTSNNGVFKEVQQNTFESLPNELSKDVKLYNIGNDDIKMKEYNEVHVLPTIHVQEAPIIIEKEVEYVKPVEIHQTVIHRIKPTIIEQPVVIEKHEHYREPTQVKHDETLIIKEDVSNINNLNTDEETINKLQSQRKAQFNDVTPIIEHSKETIVLDTQHEVQPTQVLEKEIIYQQPVEITRTEIEKIKPTVIENVTLEKQHIHEKVEPQIITKDVERIDEGDKFYSQTETTTTSRSATSSNTDTEMVV